MKQYLLALAISSLTLSANSFADHNGGGYDCYAAMNHAYRLADIGEYYAGNYDYGFSNAANSLHHAATELYYALSNQCGGTPRYDHNGGGIEILHQMVNQVGYRVDTFVQFAPYGVGSQARSVYQSLRNALGC